MNLQVLVGDNTNKGEVNVNLKDIAELWQTDVPNGQRLVVMV